MKFSAFSSFPFTCSGSCLSLYVSSMCFIFCYPMSQSCYLVHPMYYAFRSWSIEGHSNPPQQLSRGVAFMPFRELIAPSGKWVSLRFPLSELFSIRKDCFTPRSFRKGLCLCKDPTVNTCFIICPAVYFISLPTTNNFWVARKIK